MGVSRINKILICSPTPYFLEKDNLWFEKNLTEILKARKTQSFFEDNTLFLEKNQSYNFSHFLRKLDEMGYERVWQVQELGEFSQRGEVIDVFPINSHFPVRFEFLGNKIEEIFVLPIKISDEKSAKEILKKKLRSQKFFSDLRGLKPGDYLVHLDHGISRFLGIKSNPYYPFLSREIRKRQNKKSKELNYYVLEYAQGDRLYVPVGLERKLFRYIGFVEPKISRLGSSVWQKTKKKIKEEVEKFAKELLEIYAKREITTRPPYLPEDEIDFQLASTFTYEETADQIQTIKEINADLKKTEPMDRIVCGDVGFGKTEIALRTMVRAVKSGYQAAMICPTTILANQHFQNFRERLKNLPITIAMLSRIQSKKEQKRIIEKLKDGKIDIVVATHRLFSKDIEEWINKTGNGPDYNNSKKGLGLLVIDDEQKFGVKQKEKFKKLRTALDILSLSATPIPRTLYMALSSLKDISLIQTPPIGRLPVKTFVLPFSEMVIKKAIKNEISRGGQVYYLHNRIETIESVRRFLENLFSSAKDIRLSTPRKDGRTIDIIRIGIAHGRMKEKELLKVMDELQNKKIDVLIATTIIENGLDLPNVNTLIVADSSRLGLAQSYQIRGRIGRSHIQSFAYFLHGKYLPEKAKTRLNALKEAKILGSGYRIALKDLEIRGTGNILGKEQSGNINKVGLNLYCQLLSEAVEKMKKNI